MKYLKTLTLALLLFITPTLLFAENISVSDVLGDQEIDDDLITQLDEQEEAREDDFESQLLLSIPKQTDNPSYILTFTDPSTDKEGVQIEIDSSKYIEVKSPYSLPALSIGQHTLNFKFTDDEGAKQTLEKELIVLPRPPILDVPKIEGDVITISGTTLANSEVLLLITHDAVNKTVTLDTDSDGIFTYAYTPENISDSIFNISAYTRKYGYASNLSELKTFSNTSTNNMKTEDNGAVVFSISSLSNPKQIYNDSPEFIIYSGIVLVLGFLFAVILLNLFRNGNETKKIKKLEKEIKVKKTKGEKELTLREKLAMEQKETKKAPKKEDKKKIKKETPKKTEKVVSKENFMKDFKSYDPDTKKGKERKVKVSLTSKK